MASVSQFHTVICPSAAIICTSKPDSLNRLFFPNVRNLPSLSPILRTNIHPVSRFEKSNPCYYSTGQLQQQDNEKQEEEEEEEFQVLTAVRSKYNEIVIVETRKSRMLLLDSTHNVHSILNKGLDKWTGSYWDEFAALPAIVPEGPIAIYGLGGGTAAHLMLEFWPSLQLEGWEIDDILIDKARDYLGLCDLEKPTKAGGVLNVHIGDVFSALGDVSRPYAGIVVDLFSEGKVLAQLQEVTTWLKLNDRLMPHGRFMVNCGGIDQASDASVRTKSVDCAWTQNSTIRALSEAFPGQVSWKRTPDGQGANFLALTGPLPDWNSWSASVPPYLSKTVKQWMPCESSS